MIARYWQDLSPALRRYYRSSLLPCLLFLSSGALHEWAARRPGLALWARVACAAAPVLCLAWMFVLYLRFLRACDELERRIETEALAWAAGIGMVLACAAVFLLDAALVAWDATGVAAAIMVLMTTVYGLVRAFLHGRYP